MQQFVINKFCVVFFRIIINKVCSYNVVYDMWVIQLFIVYLLIFLNIEFVLVKMVWLVILLQFLKRDIRLFD